MQSKCKNIDVQISFEHSKEANLSAIETYRGFTLGSVFIVVSQNPLINIQ